MRTFSLHFIFYAFFSLFFAISFIVFPQHTYDASLRGLDTWWRIVFPSLLPFFIIADLMIQIGVVKFIGRFLEPFMRPLFNVPGSGGFVLALGMASGFPAGARLTAHLRQEKILNQIEAERLVSFSNSSNPLFIFGAIAVGLFHDESLGILLAFSHYGGNLIVGLCMRFYKHNKLSPTHTSKPLNIWTPPSMKPLGELLGNAVYTSMQTLFMIGGFIILFSVIHEILSLLHVTLVLAFILQSFFFFIPFHHELSSPFISGLLEVTLGSQKISNLNDIPLVLQLTAISFLLGFNGFSVHAQVASILAKTDIRFTPFFLARILHGLLSSLICYTLSIFFIPKQQTVRTINLNDQTSSFFPMIYNWLLHYGGWITFFSLFLFLIWFIKNKESSFK